jgi:hypothetical protein
MSDSLANVTIYLGDDNPLTIDLGEAGIHLPMNEGDAIWFTAKRDLADPDEDSVIAKGKNVAGRSGIVVLDLTKGIIRIDVSAADVPMSLADTDHVLEFDVQFRAASDHKMVTILHGFARLVRGVT